MRLNVKPTVVIAATVAALGVSTQSGATTSQPCLYPQLNVWLSGGSVNVQQGSYMEHSCPLASGKHRLTIKRLSATRAVIGVIPVNK